MPWTTALLHVLTRELRALRRQVEAYPDDESPWRMLPGISNPGGTLALHLSGNLRHFVGALLGGSGYVRDRDAEFSTRSLTRRELTERIDATLAEVTAALDGRELEPDADFPGPVMGMAVRTDEFLLHLAAHLAYHLGQVDYHRRIVTGGGPAGALSLAELPSVRSLG
ncbi:MAG TPA: DUF664 domain-containing protein [Longimicrobiaceae bacterium]|nr:DUF664 domain-containing protein [Longimicrobiaceae bacterium]